MVVFFLWCPQCSHVLSGVATKRGEMRVDRVSLDYCAILQGWNLFLIYTRIYTLDACPPDARRVLGLVAEQSASPITRSRPDHPKLVKPPQVLVAEKSSGSGDGSD